MTIQDIQSKLKTKELNAETLINKSQNKIQKIKKNNQIFLNLVNDPLKMIDKNQQDSPLYGITFSLKDNILTKDIITTAGSKILENFIPSQNAYCFDKLLNNGAILMGKTNMDELGMNGTGLSSAYGEVLNPWNSNKISSGSSSGSAVSVALGIVQFSLGTDTGDSVRSPAAACGIVGFKPSWNRISKLGVIPYTQSLDTIGILTRYVEDAALVYSLIQGYDQRDNTSLNPKCKLFDQLIIEGKDKEYLAAKKDQNYKALLIDKPKNDIVVIQEVYDSIKLNLKLIEIFDNALNKLQAKGYKIHFESIGKDILDLLLPCYNVLSFSEALSCQSYLQGITHGLRLNSNSWKDTIIKTRDKFTTKIKKRQIIGAYFLLQDHKKDYFDKVKQFRFFLKEKLKTIYDKYDIIFLPSFGEPENICDVKNKNNKIESSITYDHCQYLLANFYGSPSITIPIGFINGMPIGCSINANIYEEGKCLSFAKDLEDCFDFKGMIAKEYCE